MVTKKKSQDNFKIVTLLVIVIAIVTFLLLRPRGLPVDTAVVRSGLLQVTVDAEGKTRVSSRYDIAAPAEGHLERIQLDEGDSVQKGQVVAVIDPLPLTSSINEALAKISEWEGEKRGIATLRPKSEELHRANARIESARAAHTEAAAKVREAQARLAQARRDVERARLLAAQGAIPTKDFEYTQLEAVKALEQLKAASMTEQIAQSEITVAQAELGVLTKKIDDPDYLKQVYDARIAAAQAEIAKLSQERARTTVRAPVSGKVLRIFQESEKYVTDGTPLLQIGSTDALELVIDVLTSEAASIRKGQTVLLDQSGPDGKPIMARVRMIEPSGFTEISPLGVEEQRVNVIADIVGAPEPLADAFRVDAHIITWEEKNVLKVPVSALFRHNKKWAVYIVDDGRAVMRNVDIAEKNQLEARVKSGLRAGEMVILHPSDQVKEGALVNAHF